MDHSLIKQELEFYSKNFFKDSCVTLFSYEKENMTRSLCILENVFSFQ